MGSFNATGNANLVKSAPIAPLTIDPNGNFYYGVNF
jgi:hypothetical protein